MTTFADLGVMARLVQTLYANKLTVPTPVQAGVIPSALKGMDVLASAPTGTGKTAAFVLPALQQILKNPSPVKGRGPRVVVLTPTRELSQQIMTNVRMMAQGAQIRTGVIVGGVSYGPQYTMLRDNLDLLVATPGRLIDHTQEGKVDYSRVEMVVLDEADKMLDMGFLKPVQTILKAIEVMVRARPQMLLLTATLAPSVESFARSTLRDPVRVTLAPAKVDHSQIKATAYRADDANHKMLILDELLKGVGQAIIFAATKHGADKLAEKLQARGFASAALHGGMKQNARKRTLDGMHAGRTKLLVATDVAARGIDIKNLSHVINFDLPQVAEDFVHRIGRTGRAGATGVAISLVDYTDVPMLKDIEKVLGKRVELLHYEGLAPQMDERDFARKGAAAPRSRQTARGRGGFGGGRSGGGFGGKPQQGAARRMSERSGRDGRSYR